MKRPPSNVFNLSHDRKMSITMKDIYPILAMECVPGDSFHINSASLVRLAPMVAPVMHQVNVYHHYFFVPNRLIWPEEGVNLGWERFITAGEQGTDNPSFPVVTLNNTRYNSRVLWDFMGLPDPQGAAETVSALPFAAYQFIYNEFYRDQNLIPPVTYKVTDGNNDLIVGDLDQLRTRSWQHDYFTSSLPFTQRGPEATIPLGTSADIDVTGSGLSWNQLIPTAIARVDNTSFAANDVTYPNSGNFGGVESASLQIQGTSASVNVTTNTSVDPTALTADLSTATAASINDLRNAFRLQEWLENNARGGSRYTEVIYAHFGVKNPDARLQRPEFIGGSANPVSFSEVLQTSSTDATTPQANMAGHGVSVGQGRRNKYYCKEHGYIIGVMTIMPKTAYYQGIPKHFRKFDRFDYYWKEFAHIGEQPTYNWELYVDNDGQNDDVFGYLPRYAEYKHLPSTVHGEFRTTLDFWHMARKFATRPNLNAFFLEDLDDTTRIFAVPDAEQFYCHVYLEIKARRPMPYFGRPYM